MRVLVSRVKSSSVRVNDEVVGSSKEGLLILSCYTLGDDEASLEYTVKKCLNLRIFEDENGVMNKSIIDVGGEILSISQFTLYADVKKGNRPSYNKALGGEEAVRLYDKFNKMLGEHVHVETGVFGSDMEIEAVHDGPVNIIMDSK